MARLSTPHQQLNSIIRLLRDFDPPVHRFESGIRSTPFRVLISVLLSSRTRDPVTLRASNRLFSRAGTPEQIVRLGESRIAELIYPVGFYRQKAAHIFQIGRRLSADGRIPDSFEELVSLPGVGRKTANLVLSLAFNQPAIAVDTHVFRISKRLGWTDGADPESVEHDLENLFPRASWQRLNRTLVGFGQVFCTPRHPKCPACHLRAQCRYAREQGYDSLSVNEQGLEGNTQGNHANENK